MKIMSRFGIAFFAVFFLLCFFPRGTFAAEEVAVPVAMTETVTLGKGGTLWAVFKAQQLPNQDWPKYWEEASRLSGIPHTDAAWRKLSIGTVITVPRDPRALLAESQLRLEQALSELKTLSAELTLMRQHLAKLEAEIRVLRRNALILAAIALFAFCFVCVMIYRDYRSKDKKTTDLADLEVPEEGNKPSLVIAPCCALPPHTPPSDIKQRNLDGWHPM